MNGSEAIDHEIDFGQQTHVELASRLPSAKKLRNTHPDLFKLSDSMGFLTLFLDWAQIVLIAAFSIYMDHWIVTIPCIFLIGFKQFVLSESAVHLASHQTLFKTREWNRRFEFLYSLPFVRTVDDYQKQHSLHHRIANSENDTVYFVYDMLNLSNKNINVYWNVLVKPFLGSIAYAFAFQWIPYWIRNSTLKRNFQLLAFYTFFSVPFFYFGHVDYLILYWFIPLFFIMTQITVINEIAEHYRCKSAARQRTGWTNLFNHNEGYHFVHHAYPSIPWFKLKKANQILSPYLDRVETCNGFIFSSVTAMARQSELPYVLNYPNPAKQKFYG